MLYGFYENICTLPNLGISSVDVGTLMTMKRLTIITGNLAKLKEIVDIIGDNVPFEIIHQNIDLPEYQGDIDFIVSEKCKAAAKIVDGPVLVEDTSLW